ncbi:hypothetical protein HIM_12254 [Hirsutella minnesotensis 3608]|uniref:Uncharacterized protein n=1 Tax=Hirsutella minnesotensis 3608 TaxID=1043627 RepID=A0A0F7ZQS1_9HYPO|nr:hypothetical protein HIM_12254 [Hirsutella minnesotensis 3608]
MEDKIETSKHFKSLRGKSGNGCTYITERNDSQRNTIESGPQNVLEELKRSRDEVAEMKRLNKELSKKLSKLLEENGSRNYLMNDKILSTTNGRGQRLRGSEEAIPHLRANEGELQRDMETRDQRLARLEVRVNQLRKEHSGVTARNLMQKNVAARHSSDAHQIDLGTFELSQRGPCDKENLMLWRDVHQQQWKSRLSTLLRQNLDLRNRCQNLQEENERAQGMALSEIERTVAEVRSAITKLLLLILANFQESKKERERDWKFIIDVIQMAKRDREVHLNEVRDARAKVRAYENRARAKALRRISELHRRESCMDSCKDALAQKTAKPAMRCRVGEAEERPQQLGNMEHSAYPETGRVKDDSMIRQDSSKLLGGSPEYEPTNAQLKFQARTKHENDRQRRTSGMSTAEQIWAPSPKPRSDYVIAILGEQWEIETIYTTPGMEHNIDRISLRHLRDEILVFPKLQQILCLSQSELDRATLYRFCEKNNFKKIPLPVQFGKVEIQQTGRSQNCYLVRFKDGHTEKFRADVIAKWGEEPAKAVGREKWFEALRTKVTKEVEEHINSRYALHGRISPVRAV